MEKPWLLTSVPGWSNAEFTLGSVRHSIWCSSTSTDSPSSLAVRLCYLLICHLQSNPFDIPRNQTSCYIVTFVRMIHFLHFLAEI